MTVWTAYLVYKTQLPNPMSHKANAEARKAPLLHFEDKVSG